MAKRRRTKRYHPPGTAPGILAAHEEAAGIPVEMTLVRYDEGRHEERSLPKEEVATLAVPSDGVLWLDVRGLSDPALVRAVGDRFGFHRLALEDALNVGQRPKVDDYGDHALVVLREVPYPDDPEQVCLFLGERVVVTFREKGGESFAEVRRRLAEGKGFLRNRGADTLLHALCDAVLDSFFPALERVGEDLDALEERAVVAASQETFREIQGMKRSLLAFRHALWPSRDAMAELQRGHVPHVTEGSLPFFHDCYDHTVQLMDVVESYREIASGLLDEYMMSVSNRMNEIMKVLTIVATLFIPLSFVTGLYGMNFDRTSPWNLPELGWRYGYPFALGAMAAIAGGMLWFFRRRRWI